MTKLSGKSNQDTRRRIRELLKKGKPIQQAVEIAMSKRKK